MKKVMVDWRLIIGYILAHPLIYFAFEERKVFWYIFTAAILVLISYAILHEELVINHSKWTDFSLGLFSGVVLYGLFWLGSSLFDLFNLPFSGQITQLYKQYAPTTIIHYIILIFIIAPGEELFWRGFIQKRLLNHTGIWTSMILSTFLYASVQFYSGEFTLVMAAIIGGFLWSALYAWKRSIRLVIISHIIFDLFLFGFFPLR